MYRQIMISKMMLLYQHIRGRLPTRAGRWMLPMSTDKVFGALDHMLWASDLALELGTLRMDTLFVY